MLGVVGVDKEEGESYKCWDLIDKIQMRFRLDLMVMGLMRF